MERELETIHNFSSENDHFYSREKIEENCICVLSSSKTSSNMKSELYQTVMITRQCNILRVLTVVKGHF